MRLYHGDCLKVMNEIPNQSVDMVLCDPPYYKIVSEDWDKFKGLGDYLLFIRRVAELAKLKLKKNGSFYIFGDDKIIAYVQVELDKLLYLLNSIVWYKTNNQSIKAAPNLRSYAPMTERVLFYTPQPCQTGLETIKLDANNFKPLRDYFRDYQHALGLSIKKINQKLGHRKAEHAFYWKTTQWDLPTEETYNELSNLDCGSFSRREYEELRREYEELRRVFNASSHTLDVITGPIVKQSENTDHPTTKPIWLLKDLIKNSTNQGMMVLDPMMGSGSTGVACLKTGRQFIGIEKDADYFRIAKERIEKEAQQTSFLYEQPEIETIHRGYEQLRLT